MSESAWVLCEYRFIASADVSALEGAGGAPHVVVETRDERTTRVRALGDRIQAIALPEEEGTLRGERLRDEDGVVTDLHGADSPLRTGLLRGPTAGKRKQDCCQERDHSRHSSAGDRRREVVIPWVGRRRSEPENLGRSENWWSGELAGSVDGDKRSHHVCGATNCNLSGGRANASG